MEKVYFNYPVMAMVHSRKETGPEEVLLICRVNENDYIVETKDGVHCYAIFNPFVCLYYADDIFRKIEKPEEDIESAISQMLNEACEGSYYTITGVGGDPEEWMENYQKILDEQEIGKIQKWISFTGKNMNEKYNLTGDNRYPDSLHFLAFPLDGLDVHKLAILKLQMGDRWFDDIVDNNARREAARLYDSGGWN